MSQTFAHSYIINFLDVIYVSRGNKNPKIVFQQNEYIINKKTDEKTAWRCTMYEKTSCRSRLVTQGRTLAIKSPHNHPPSKTIHPKDAVKQFVTIQFHY